MRKPNKNKMAGVNSRFASVSDRFLMVSFENVVEITSCVYTKTLSSALRGSVNILPLFTEIEKNNC